MLSKTELGRFMSHVVKQEDGCWLWGGRRDAHRYASFGRRGAHRVAFEHWRGPILPGLQVCHSCDQRMCVNPEHLWLGSAQHNMLDRERKGRGMASLSDAAVRRIFSLRMWGLSIAEAADRERVPYNIVQRIWARKSFRRLTPGVSR